MLYVQYCSFSFLSRSKWLNCFVLAWLPDVIWLSQSSVQNIRIPIDLIVLSTIYLGADDNDALMGH